MDANATISHSITKLGSTPVVMSSSARSASSATRHVTARAACFLYTYTPDSSFSSPVLSPIDSGWTPSFPSTLMNRFVTGGSSS